MKKTYLLFSALLLSTAAFSQNNNFQSKPFIESTKVFSKTNSSDRTIGNPDTTGFVNFTDFLPQFASISQTAIIYGYSGGGYVFGNNKDGLKICGQGYQNINATPVKIIAALVWFGAKQRDLQGGAASKVVVSLFDMAANKAYNTDGSGAFNNTTLNAPGPSGLAKSSVELLWDDIDTVGNNMNYLVFPTASYCLGDFAITVDASTLTAGDTVGIVSDNIGDAQELDYAFHKIGTKWIVTDQAFSVAANGGTGGLDLSIAIFAVLSDATGVNEYFNGMKLNTYPNPANKTATIEYTLEKNSNKVGLIIFDKAGHKLIERVYHSQAAGSYKVEAETANFAAGTYFYQLNANGQNFTKQIVVTH